MQCSILRLLVIVSQLLLLVQLIWTLQGTNCYQPSIITSLVHSPRTYNKSHKKYIRYNKRMTIPSRQVNGDYQSSTALCVLLDSVVEPTKNELPPPQTTQQQQQEQQKQQTNIADVERPLCTKDMDSFQTNDETWNVAMPLVIMALCWAIALLSALDRVAMSVAVIPLSEEMGYSDATKGAISSFFSVGYGLAIIPAGLVVAVMSPKMVMAMGVALWSLATIATPFTAGSEQQFYYGSSTTPSLLPLFLTRACVGAAESVVLPTIQRLMLTWVPPERKSLAVATIFSGFQSGTIAAYLASPAVMEFAGWRGLFYLYGGIGLFLLLPWFAFARDAPTIINTTSLDLNGIENDPISSSNMKDSKELLLPSEKEKSSWQEAIDVWKTAPWKGLVQSKGVWAIVLAHAANNWGLYNSLSWTPTFYAEQYGLDVRDSAWLSVLPSVAGAVGGILAGSIADAIIANLPDTSDDRQITMVRKVFQGIALYGPAVTLAYLATHIPNEAWVAQFMLMGTVGMQSFNAAGYGAANQEKAGERWAGLLYSITSLPGVMIGSFGVYVTGQILDLTHQDWSIVFGINAIINVLGATAFIALFDSKREFD